MNKIIRWFEINRTLSIVIAIVYYLAVVLPHKAFGTFLNTQVFKGITRAEYNRYVLIGSIIPLCAYLFLFIQRSLKADHKKKLWALMTVNIIAAILIIKYLFVINIEMVHFPQYAMMAIILFPIVGNYQATLIWATIAGAVDEAYQYFYLSPLDTSYFDFNDVLTNLVGAVFGLLLLSSSSVKESSKFVLKKSSIWIGLGAIALVIFLAHLFGILSIYPSDERPFHIVREFPEGFWTTTRVGVTYHIVRPVEGIILTFLLWFTFYFLKPNLSSHA